MGIVPKEGNLSIHEPVIFVVGLPGVGKSTLAAMLAGLLSTKAINSGDALRCYMRKNNVSLKDLVSTGDVFLRQFGQSAVGPAILEEADLIAARIVDGPRLFSTYDHYLQKGRNVLVVLLTAEEDVRRRRFRERSIQENEADADSVDDLLRKKDEWGGDLDQFEAVSKWKFDNSGSLGNLEKFGCAVASQISLARPASNMK
jgi:cytidylate kinase